MDAFISSLHHSSFPVSLPIEHCFLNPELRLNLGGDCHSVISFWSIWEWFQRWVDWLCQWWVLVWGSVLTSLRTKSTLGRTTRNHTVCQPVPMPQDLRGSAPGFKALQKIQVCPSQGVSPPNMSISWEFSHHLHVSQEWLYILCFS